jgi:hypothetical protein
MTPENQTKYLRLVRWAERRYREGPALRTKVGGKPTRYTLIEAAAWRKYAGPQQSVVAGCLSFLE